MDYDMVLTIAVIHELIDNTSLLASNASVLASLLRHIWLCQLDSGLYAVAVWSFVFHGLGLGANAVVSSILEPYDRQIRGCWARLTSVGAMNSVLYTLEWW